MPAPAVHNWGRWGADDERGCLNFQTPERVLDAVRLVRQGRVYNLAVPLGAVRAAGGGLGHDPVHRAGDGG